MVRKYLPKWQLRKISYRKPALFSLSDRHIKCIIHCSKSYLMQIYDKYLSSS
ncbi:hypothetical protein D3C87_1937280 [compost metagenome]